MRRSLFGFALVAPFARHCGTTNVENAERAAREVRHERRRRHRREKSMDDVLVDVLQEALKQRDEGKDVDTAYIQRQAQEKFYEARYGRKPPSGDKYAMKYVPFPPDPSLHRVLPLRLFDDDPWPQRSISADNPVLRKSDIRDDEQFLRYEERLFEIPAGWTPEANAMDAMDELTYWKIRFVEFLRSAPLWQRRSLPLLHENYRLYAHRLIRAEQRFIRARDLFVGSGCVAPDAYSATEAEIEDVRSLLADTYHSLGAGSYDPTSAAVQKKSPTGPLLTMEAEAFAQWCAAERLRRDKLTLAFSSSKGG